MTENYREDIEGLQPEISGAFEPLPTLEENQKDLLQESQSSRDDIKGLGDAIRAAINRAEEVSLESPLMVPATSGIDNKKKAEERIKSTDETLREVEQYVSEQRDALLREHPEDSEEKREDILRRLRNKALVKAGLPPIEEAPEDKVNKYIERQRIALAEEYPEESEEVREKILRRLRVKAERKENIKARIKEIVDIPDMDRELRLWLRNIVSVTDGPKMIALFFKNLEKNKILADTVRHNPNMFEDLFESFSRNEVLNDGQTKVLIQNIEQRFNEIESNNKEFSQRIMKDPKATSEELRLGRYREQIESQIRDAVFVILNKGYQIYESGFYEPNEGEQYIGFHLDNRITVPELQKCLDGISGNISSVKVKQRRGVIQIFLTPAHKTMSQAEWKPIWDLVAEKLPMLRKGNESEEMMLIDNGLQGVEFREAQKKMERGEDVWLGQEQGWRNGSTSGFAFVDGQVRKMSKFDFAKIEHDRELSE